MKKITEKLDYKSFIFLYRIRQNLLFKKFNYKLVYCPNKIEQSISSIDELEDILSDSLKNEISKFELALEEKFNNTKYEKKRKYLAGTCDVCKRITRFEYQFIPDSHENNRMNWRESMCCCHCGFNNRIRYIIKEIMEVTDKNSDIYITEQVTLLYKFLHTKYSHLIGSEYISDSAVEGKLYNGIRHEDMTKLSFANESMDCIVSADVLEHVNNIYQAIDEVYRVLRKNGYFICSVPFLYDELESQVRSIIEDGIVKHLLPPEIHGNPISDDGSLVFTIPGWDMVEYCKSLFTDVNVDLYFNPEEGHMAYASGVPQIIFRMKK